MEPEPSSEICPHIGHEFLLGGPDDSSHVMLQQFMTIEIQSTWCQINACKTNVNRAKLHRFAVPIQIGGNQ